VWEALRLFPSAPLLSRYAVKDDILPDSTFVPAGALLHYSPMVFGSSDELWGSDVSEFNPDRFVGETSPSEYKHIAFGGGSRACIGKQMALLGVKLFLATILGRYHIHVWNANGINSYTSITLPVKGGLHVSLHPRT